MEIREIVFVYELAQPRAIEWHTRYHSHEPQEYEIHYFFQGSGSFRSKNAVQRISGGSAIFCRPLESHAIQASDPEDPISYYAVLFRTGPEDEEIRELLESKIDLYPRISLGSGHRFFFEKLKEQSESTNSLVRTAALHRFLGFLYELLGSLEQMPKGKTSNFHVEKALRIMQRQVFNPMTVKDLAQRLELNPAYLIRLFQRHLQVSPKQYMLKLKIEAGAAMLISSTRPVYEIADLLHFSSEFHFSRVFKQHTGQPPREYREAHKQVTPDVL